MKTNLPNYFNENKKSGEKKAAKCSNGGIAGSRKNV